METPPPCKGKKRVAPVRERGLKYTNVESEKLRGRRRSREGAWIEIASIPLRYF